MSGDRAPVKAAIRVDDRNPGHTTISVFIGRNEGARGHSGRLVVRTDELDELGVLDGGRLVIAFDVLAPLHGAEHDQGEPDADTTR